MKEGIFFKNHESSKHFSGAKSVSEKKLSEKFIETSGEEIKFKDKRHSIKFVDKPGQEGSRESRARDLKNQFCGVYKKNLKKLNEPVMNFVSNLRKKYPDYEDYALYHALSGTPDPKKGCSKYDFHGEDSVEKFIENLSEDSKLN